jgi:lysophospholipase L1-like esterase
MVYRENIEWLDIWVPSASESVLPRVLLIGDSITRSYYPHVQERLAGRYACARIASSKCVADPMYLRELQLILDAYEFACIHFNNGLHGWDYNESAYAIALAETFSLLARHCGTKHLIWASTTPVWTKGDAKILDAKTERVRERNRIAADMAASYNVQINDLFSYVVEQPDLFSKDGVHFLEAGQVMLGRHVADVILSKTDNT